MKGFILFVVLLSAMDGWAVCSSQISRTNSVALTALTASKYNTDLNTLYTRVNELPGDCIEDASVTSLQIANGTIATADIADSAVTPAKLSGSNYALSSSDSGSYSATVATYADVTNLTATITTNGRPVIITLVNGTVGAAATNQISATIYLKAVRGVTDLSEYILASQDGNEVVGSDPSIIVPSGSFVWYDDPVAGTYTYKIRAKSLTTSINTEITSARLFVREL